MQSLSLSYKDIHTEQPILINNLQKYKHTKLNFIQINKQHNIINKSTYKKQKILHNKNFKKNNISNHNNNKQYTFTNTISYSFYTIKHKNNLLLLPLLILPTNKIFSSLQKLKNTLTTLL